MLYRLLTLGMLALSSLSTSWAGVYFSTYKFTNDPTAMLEIRDYDYYYESYRLNPLHVNMLHHIISVEKNLNHYRTFCKEDFVWLLVSTIPNWQPYLIAIKNNQREIYKDIIPEQTYSQYMNEYSDFCVNQSPIKVKGYNFSCNYLIKVFTVLSTLPDAFIRELNRVALNQDIVKNFNSHKEEFLQAIGNIEDPNSQANHTLKLYYGISITK